MGESLERRTISEPPPGADAPADRFERLWQQGRPDLSAFLAEAGPLGAADLAAVLRADLRLRWRGGERPPAEGYLELYRAAHADPEYAFDLVYEEFRVREELGEGPRPDEYDRRFP